MNSHLDSAHLADLKKSGLSEVMIKGMGIESKIRNDLLQLLENGNIVVGDTGYTIQYLTRYGEATSHCNVRLMQGIPMLDEHNKPTCKVIKYLKPRNTPNLIYWPPGVQALLKAHPYCLITEGEKKAAKAVQEGIPCIAIAGVWNWADKEARDVEKAQGKGVSYQTRPLSELQELAKTHKLILLFDSDVETNKDVQKALRLLRDTLLFYGATWVRTLLMPKPSEEPVNAENTVITPAAGDGKIGLDDLLLLQDGLTLLNAALKEELGKNGQDISPLAVIQYGTARDGTPLRYVIPNSTPSTACKSHVIFKQVEKLQENPNKDAAPVYDIVSMPVAHTRLWCSRVIADIDHLDQNLTRYEVAYVPLTQRMAHFRRGDASILNVSKEDHYANHNASILQNERAAIADLFHACQTHGYAKKVYGTSKRGWVSFAHGSNQINGFMKPQGIITEDGFFLSDRKDCPLLPIPIGSEDAVLSSALTQKGDAKQGALLLYTYVLSHPLPALMCASAVAGLLLNTCPDAENFTVHLYGESSNGKTTALRAAASLFGDPKTLIKQWRTTDNGLEASLVARNDLAIFLDETGQQPNQDVLNNAAYLIANGGQKSRASRDGSEREVRTFRIIALSTGEQTLLQGQINGGQETRVLQLPTDLLGPLWGETTSEQIERLTSGLNTNYGWALEPLVTTILNWDSIGRKSLATEMATYLEAYRTTLDKDAPQIVLRRAKHYALLTVALRLLLQVCLTTLEERDIEALIRKHMEYFFRHVRNKMLVLPSDQYQRGEINTLVPYFYEQLEININRIHGMTDNKVVGDHWGYKKGDLVGIMRSKFEGMAGTWGCARMIAALDAAQVLVYTPAEAKGYGKQHNLKVEKGKSLRMYVVSYSKLIAFAVG